MSDLPFSTQTDVGSAGYGGCRDGRTRGGGREATRLRRDVRDVTEQGTQRLGPPRKGRRTGRLRNSRSRNSNPRLPRGSSKGPVAPLSLDLVPQLRLRLSCRRCGQPQARNRPCRLALEHRPRESFRLPAGEGDQRLPKPLSPLARLGKGLDQTLPDELRRPGSRAARNPSDRGEEPSLLVRGKAANLGDDPGRLLGAARVRRIEAVRQQARQLGRASLRVALLGDASRLVGDALPHLTPAINARQRSPPGRSGGTPLGENVRLDYPGFG